jgi:hypothetical protein
MLIRFSRLCRAVGGAVLLATSLLPVHAQSPAPSKVDAIALLLPDDADVKDPKVTVWTDAMAEQGLQTAIVRDSEFLSPVFATKKYAGVIMPDQVHVKASDALVAGVISYVNGGGKLLLNFDAGSLTDTGFYPIPKSRFSSLVGIDYALYEELRDKTFGFGPVVGTEKTLTALRLAPGKFMPYDGQFTDMPTPQDAPDGKLATVEGTELYAPSGYVYGYLGYPGFVTRGTYTGVPLLTSPAFGLAAGYNVYGKGSVLFVNVPLGHMKHQTDGVFLHGFLHYFANDILHLPYLAAVPKGVGGLIFNWHLCSGVYAQNMKNLKAKGVFNQGPFSIHITAGPDGVTPGDKLGWDLPNNPTMQKMLADLAKQGHQIASHGGWCHDHWGQFTTEENQADFERFLIWNKDAVEKATRKPMLEYSAPWGNQPQWASDWLEQRGILGYYFTGNGGMAPTRSYRNGNLWNKKMWSIPISTYGPYATFEEFEEFGVSHQDAASWLVAMTNFSSQYRVARTVYCHPGGAEDYLDSVSAMLNRAAAFKKQGRFNWYTMAGIATFLNQREKIVWSTSALADGTRVLDASHPTSLQDATWVFPKSHYAKPVISKGSGQVVVQTGHAKPKLKELLREWLQQQQQQPQNDDLRSKLKSLLQYLQSQSKSQPSPQVTESDDEWLVIAGNVKALQIKVKPVAP